MAEQAVSEIVLFTKRPRRARGAEAESVHPMARFRNSLWPRAQSVLWARPRMPERRCSVGGGSCRIVGYSEVTNG